MLDLGSGRSCQSYNGALAYFINNGTYTPVLRAEIMSPFRYAVSFVDGIE